MTFLPTFLRQFTSYTAVAGAEGELEWQAMGVYDDEDLEDGQLMLLHCPKTPHYVWVGGEFSPPGGDKEGDEMLEWVCTVGQGEHTQWADAQVWDLSLQRGGEESDEFWDKFNEGF